MMRRLIPILICCMLILTGCSDENLYGQLPENPVVFVQEDFVNPRNAEDTYMSIEYNGRRYVPYGTLGGMIRSKDVKACVGYIFREDFPDDTNARIYLLKEDESVNYLMDYYVSGMMEQPLFYRAIDTKGRVIDTPKFIDSLDYEYWN